MEIKRLKYQVNLCEKDRAEMKRRTKLPGASEKMTKLLKDKIKRKDAEIATIQVIITQSSPDHLLLFKEQINSAESHENPVSAKRLPIKDTAEARKLIEFLVHELIEQGGDCLIQTENAEQLVSLYLFKNKIITLIFREQISMRSMTSSTSSGTNTWALRTSIKKKCD